MVAIATSLPVQRPRTVDRLRCGATVPVLAAQIVLSSVAAIKPGSGRAGRRRARRLPVRLPGAAAAPYEGSDMLEQRETDTFLDTVVARALDTSMNNSAARAVPVDSHGLQAGVPARLTR